MTVLFDAIRDEVVTLTNRPELVTETAMGIRQATLRAHMSDFFPRDLQNTGPVAISGSSVATVAFDTSTLARFRAANSVYLLDANQEPMLFVPVEMTTVGDIYEIGYSGVRRPNIAWLAGTALNVYAPCGFYGLQMDWYQSPNLLEAAYDSWIAAAYPDVIVWEAAMMVWNRSGNEQKAKEAYDVLHGNPRMPNAPGLYDTLKATFLQLAAR